jgi:hypothetical protein
MSAPVPVTEECLAHWLPWWWVGDGVLVNHDGAMSTGWEITGLDIACEPDDRINGIVSTLRHLLNSLPPGYYLQVLRHCEPVPRSYFEAYGAALKTKHPVLLEQRRRNVETFSHRSLRRFRTFLLLVLPKALGRLGSHQRGIALRIIDAMWRTRDPATVTREEHATAVESLLGEGASILDGLGRLGIRARPLGDAGLVDLAYSILNPSRARLGAPQLVDAVPDRVGADGAAVSRSLSLREQLVDSGLAWDVDLLWLDDPMRPYRVMGLSGLPRLTTATQIRDTDRLSFEHWLSVGLGVPDSEAKYSDVERRRNRAKVMASGEVRNARADEQYKELEEALTAAVSRDQRFFTLSCHLLFGGKDLAEIDARTREVVSVFRDMGGAKVATELYNQVPAVLGMQAGAVHGAPHQRLVFTDTAADFVPLYQSSGGDGRPLFLAQTRNGEPYTIDLANPGRTNWNSFVLGQSGGGKTFLALSFVTSSMLGQNSPLIVIDVGGREEGSYYRLVQLLGGDFVDLGLDGRNAINPFYARADFYTDDETELPSDRPSPRKTLFLVQIAALLVTDPGDKPLSTVQLGILERAILATYERLGDTRPPVFSDLVAELEAMKLERDDKQDARRFSKTIRAWIDGPYGAVLNQQSRVNVRSNFVVFDLKGLEGVGRLSDVVVLIVTAYVWNLVAKPRAGNLAWVVWDEVWKAMQNDMAANLQRELYKTARKLRVGLISITQELRDFLATPASRSVLAGSTSVFVLPHREGHDAVADLLNLNDRERRLFKGGPGTPGLGVEKGLYSEFLYRTAGPPERTTVLRHVTTPAEYWINTTDGQDKQLERTVLAEMGGDRLATLRRLMRDYPNGSHQPARRSSDV